MINNKNQDEFFNDKNPQETQSIHKFTSLSPPIQMKNSDRFRNPNMIDNKCQDGNSQMGKVQMNTNQMNKNQINTSLTNTNQVNKLQMNMNQMNTSQTNTNQLNKLQMNMNQMNTIQANMSQMSKLKLNINQTNANQVTTVQTNRILINSEQENNSSSCLTPNIINKESMEKQNFFEYNNALLNSSSNNTKPKIIQMIQMLRNALSKKDACFDYKDRDRLIFETNSNPSEWWDLETGKKIEFFPQSEEWSITLLSCLLNELISFQKDHNEKKDEFYYVHSSNKKWKIKIQFNPEIKVTASLDWIINCWTGIKTCKKSDKRKYFKSRVNEVPQIEFIFQYYMMKPNPSTFSLLNHRTLSLCSQYEFSTILYLFAEKFHANYYTKNDDTKTIHEFYKLFCKEDIYSIDSIETLKTKIKGFLMLNVQPCEDMNRNLPKIKHEGILKYITSGVNIFPSTRSLPLENPKLIKGYLLDTTWRALPYFNTSIIMGCAYNVGFSLGFSFHRSETVEGYNMLLNTITKETGIVFTSCTIESDQEKALEKVIRDNHMNHLICLRHFLAKFKNQSYSYRIKKLVEACTNFEFENDSGHNLAAPSKICCVYSNTHYCKCWNSISRPLNWWKNLPPCGNNTPIINYSKGSKWKVKDIVEPFNKLINNAIITIIH